jgi:hypothetical protein
MLRRTFMAAAVLALLSVISDAEVDPQAGITAMSFLKIGAGAGPAAMADAGIALVSDATAGYWNPARLTASATKHSLHFQHNLWIAGTSVDEIYYSLKLGRHSLGLSGRMLSSGDIPLRGELPTEQPEAYYQAYDVFAGISYGFSPFSGFALGASFRRLYEKIYLDSGYGYSLQAGLNYRIERIGLSLAGTADHLGKYQMENSYSSYKLPATFKLGAAWELPWTLCQGRTTAVLDAVKTVYIDWQVRAGVQYLWRDLAALRAGYKAGHSSEGFSAGLGLRWRSYMLDYAFVPHEYDLGTSHRFSLGLGF